MCMYMGHADLACVGHADPTTGQTVCYDIVHMVADGIILGVGAMALGGLGLGAVLRIRPWGCTEDQALGLY